MLGNNKTTYKMNDIKIISEFFSRSRTKLIKCFSIETLNFQSPYIRKQQVYVNLIDILTHFENEIYELPKDDHVFEEMIQLKDYLIDQIITKNQNKALDKYTKQAIFSNFKILEQNLDTIHSKLKKEFNEAIDEKKAKFSDVKIKNVELALFIILGSKHGLISYNEVTDTEKAKCFSKLTNFSDKSIRNFISGENKTNPNLLSLKEDNIDNLKSIIDKISEELASMKIK